MNSHGLGFAPASTVAKHRVAWSGTCRVAHPPSTLPTSPRSHLEKGARVPGAHLHLNLHPHPCPATGTEGRTHKHFQCLCPIRTGLVSSVCACTCMQERARVRGSVCVYIHESACVQCACVCVEVTGPYFFETESISGLKLAKWVPVTGSEPQGSPGFCLPSTGMCHLLHGCRGATWVLILVWQALC